MANILIIDDNQTNRLLLTTILEYHGHAIAEAADGQIALESARSSPPDLIIMDLDMPRMNGVELLKVLRTDRDLLGVAVIVHTATTADEGLRDVLELYSVSGVLPKPFEPNELSRVVDEALKR